MPTTGFEPVSRRLQRHVLTTITTLAWRADLDLNEDDQFWRLSGYRYLIDACCFVGAAPCVARLVNLLCRSDAMRRPLYTWSTRADLHGCIAELQTAGLLSCLRVHGAVGRT